MRVSLVKRRRWPGCEAAAPNGRSPTRSLTDGLLRSTSSPSGRRPERCCDVDERRVPRCLFRIRRRLRRIDPAEISTMLASRSAGVETADGSSSFCPRPLRSGHGTFRLLEAIPHANGPQRGCCERGGTLIKHLRRCSIARRRSDRPSVPRRSSCSASTRAIRGAASPTCRRPEMTKTIVFAGFFALPMR